MSRHWNPIRDGTSIGVFAVRLLALLPGLSGKRLVCHCQVGSPRHCDAIIKAYVEFVSNEAEVDAALRRLVEAEGARQAGAEGA